MEKSEMITYAEILEFLNYELQPTIFVDFENGLLVDWNYNRRDNQDMFRFLYWKWPVAISSKLDTRQVQIKFRK